MRMFFFAEFIVSFPHIAELDTHFHPVLLISIDSAGRWTLLASSKGSDSGDACYAALTAECHGVAL